MDVLAHALRACAGVAPARRRWPISPRTATLTVTLTVVPDAPHLLPVLGWSLFGHGTATAVKRYAVAIPGQETAMPQWVEFVSHHLHCSTHTTRFHRNPL